jgi:hypothetical protein
MAQVVPRMEKTRFRHREEKVFNVSPRASVMVGRKLLWKLQSMIAEPANDAIQGGFVDSMPSEIPFCSRMFSAA